MTAPSPSLQTVAVHGKYRLLDGSIPESGTVSFRIDYWLRVPTDNETIAPVQLNFNLDANGEFTAELPATNDPDTSPTGYVYHVTEKVTGAGSRTYDIMVPYDFVATPPDTVFELSDFAPVVEPPEFIEYVLVATFNALADRVTTTEGRLDNVDAELSSIVSATNYNQPEGPLQLDDMGLVADAQMADDTRYGFATLTNKDPVTGKVTPAQLNYGAPNGTAQLDGSALIPNASLQANMQRGVAGGLATLDASGNVEQGGTGGGGGTSTAVPTHHVYQSGGLTIAARADGTVITSLATSAANNPTVIQAAIDDGAATPASNTHVAGATVYIQRGQYDMATGLTAKYGVSLLGDYGGWYDNWTNAGTFGTMLIATAALTGPMISVGVSGSGGRVASNPHGLWIGRLLIDCSSTPASSDCILITDTAFVVVERCYLRGGAAGVHVAGTSGPFTGSYDIDIFDCVIKDCGRGIYVAPTSGSTSGSDGIIRGCRIMSCSINSIDLSVGGWQISGCHLTHGGAVNHIYANNVDGVQINSNYIDSGTVAGIYVKSAGASSIIGNECVADAAFTDPTGAYISVPWGKCTIQGNYLLTKSNTSGLKGFISTGDKTKGVITGNITRRRTTSTGWVAPVVDGSGVAVADRSDAGSSISGNVSWADA